MISTRRSDGHGPDGQHAEDPRSDEPEGRSALDELLGDVQRLGRASADLAWLRWRRAQRGLRRGLIFAFAGIWLALVAVAASIVAAVLVVRGIAAALASATGIVWIGDLAGGVLVLGAFAFAIWLVAAVLARRAAKTLERRLAGCRHPEP